MRVLVTGASGFVGRHLVPHLRARGHEIVAADLELDASDAPAVARFTERAAPDAIVHLAGVSSVVAAGQDPGLAFRVNYLGAHALLEATARHAPRARVLLVGSGEVYGAAERGAPLFTEASPMCPRSPYARSKAAADLLGHSYSERGLDIVRLRPFNHTGPGQSDVFVASSFAKQLVEIERGTRPDSIEVGNLDSVRDFLDVSDVVEAYALLCEPGAPAGVYNLASGRGVSAGALLECLRALAGVAPRIQVDPSRFRPTDQSVGDASRLRAAIGWAPKVPLEATLEHLLAHWRKELNAS